MPLNWHRKVVGHGACSIHLLICYLFFLFSSPLFDQRLFFYSTTLCSISPSFFSTELFPLGLFSCSFFHTTKSNFASQRKGSWEVAIPCALPGRWHRGRSMVECPTANTHALTPFQEFSVPPNYPLNRKEMLKAMQLYASIPERRDLLALLEIWDLKLLRQMERKYVIKCDILFYHLCLLSEFF